MHGQEIKLSAKEQKLIEAIRKVEHGEMRIVIQEGAPIRIEELKKSIKL